MVMNIKGWLFNDKLQIIWIVFFFYYFFGFEAENMSPGRREFIMKAISTAVRICATATVARDLGGGC
ncbi:unnamed protein product, partial [Vitis vinifera]|uniref:Uncharacterized protein n=1 Tax=Vitis vinifera TaxID=29760 RepID=D7U2J2_VITVI